MEKEKTEEFIKQYKETMAALRAKPITDEVIKEYAMINSDFGRMAAGENLIEASFLLQKLQPSISEALFLIGNNIMAELDNEFTLRENLDKLIETDPKMAEIMASVGEK